MTGSPQPERLVRAPLLIVGSPRSGTTLLGSLFACHPAVAYWEEPRVIWSQGNAWRTDDALDESHLTPGIARRVDRSFHRFLRASGRVRLVEKTPSNALRLRFVRALYPDCQVIHLVRDGRAVTASMLEMLSTPPRPARLAARLRETPLRDLPALAPLLFRDVIAPALRGGRKRWWGPRPPGWRDWLELPAPRMLARQWAALVSTARRDLREFPPGQRLELRYEELAARPALWLERIREFAGLPPGPGFDAAAAASISPNRAGRWREILDPGTLAAIEEEAGSLLAELEQELPAPCPSP